MNLKQQLLLFVSVILIFGSCHIGRFFYYNFADIRDHKKFPYHELTKNGNTFHFSESPTPIAPKKVFLKNDSMSFEEFLEETNTVAFLVIRNDSILFEKYFDGYKPSSIVPSFSMAKSVTSILIGCAIEDGFIHSVQDKMVDYIPELKSKGMDEVTIEHLLQMTSGIDFNEKYISPFSDAALFYYGRNLWKYVSKMKPETEPGIDFHYTSGSTQLLGCILDRSLKGKNITTYFQEKIWTPLGMEYNGSWSLDKRNDGLEKTFCCINARARDYAKIGRLYLNNGNWNGQQLVPEKWVYDSTHPSQSVGCANYYQYQWWIPAPGDFMAAGILGQYIYVHPKTNTIIVRLGRNEGSVSWWNILPSIAAHY